MYRIGLIADTHDLLRPEATKALAGCDQIVHAGDITVPRILEELATLAPVTAVRGNNDRDEWAQGLAETEALRFGNVGIFVIHDLTQLAQFPVPADIRVIVSGHSHKPSVREIDGVLYVNPGSAGRRRFKLPVAVAELVIENGEVSARIVELEVTPAGRASR